MPSKPIAPLAIAFRGLPIMFRSASLSSFLLALALLASLLPGCGYSLRPPFDPEIETVYVPVFRSFTFRPEQNLELTRLVQQEIIRRSRFKVVDSPE